MTESGKLKIKLLRPEDVWHPPLGAPKGSRNAAKALSTLDRQIRDLKLRARIMLRAASLQC